MTMADREESEPARKRISVACGRCRKRKIRCSGDPGNGGPCSNCKNAGYEPCLFLRVSSQETPLKDTGEYTYNIEAARAYANQRGAAVSPVSPLSHYAHEITGDGLAAYRQSAYPYTASKGYYPNLSGWGGAYQDDSGVDYNLNYSSYPILNQDTGPSLVSGYATSPYTTRKSVYVDTTETTPPYSYGSLVHRPAAIVGGSNSQDSQGFSLSSMAASLPSPADRLHSTVNRTLTSASSSSTYRTDGLPSYQNAKSPTAEVAYTSLQPYGETPYPSTGSTATATALASAIAHRATAHADAAYPPASAAPEQQLYAHAADHAIRPEDPSAGLSYVYGDSGSGSHRASRRNSHSHSNGGNGAGGSLLSNGHIYVPESHHTYAVPPSVSGRSIDGPSSPPLGGSGSAGVSAGSGNGGVSGSGSTASTASGSGSASASAAICRREDAHRRSAGSLRAV